MEISLWAYDTYCEPVMISGSASVLKKDGLNLN